MSPRSLTVGASLAAALALVSLAPTTAQAQSASRPTAQAIPRMPDGRPDLQGTYDLKTLTPVERPEGLPAVLSEAEAAKAERAVAAQLEESSRAIAPERGAPPKGGDGTPGPAGNVGGYNTFWLDLGSTHTVIDGERRTSLIVDPEDGKVPPYTAQAAARRAARRSDSVAREDDPGWEGDGQYDDPEQRPLGERCLLGFGSTSGPPALPNYFYNNLHQIVQTKDRLVILTEMVHDARIVRIGGEHLPPTIRLWMGDSVGHWEGDTLVVDTTNFTDKTRFRGSTDRLHVVERFTRVDAATLKYRFTIDDPETWDRPWTGEYTWPATDEPMYEYACHEGNYAMANILRGARLKEANDAKGQTKGQ